MYFVDFTNSAISITDLLYQITVTIFQIEQNRNKYKVEVRYKTAINCFHMKRGSKRFDVIRHRIGRSCLNTTERFLSNFGAKSRIRDTIFRINTNETNKETTKYGKHFSCCNFCLSVKFLVLIEFFLVAYVIFWSKKKENLL